jgi:multidrug resistance efflux pump
VDEKESQVTTLEAKSKKLEEARSALESELKSQQAIIESQKIKMGHVELELEKTVRLFMMCSCPKMKLIRVNSAHNCGTLKQSLLRQI